MQHPPNPNHHHPDFFWVRPWIDPRLRFTFPRLRFTFRCDLARVINLICIALRCVALHCIVLYCIVLTRRCIDALETCVLYRIHYATVHKNTIGLHYNTIPVR